MAVSLPPSSVNLESQLFSIMDVLVKAAVSEISQLFSESSATLRLHLTQSLRENDSLRMRVKLMRSELFSLKLQTRAARPSSRFGLLRASTPKPRAKAQQVVSAPAISVDTVPYTEKIATEESPDVIVIKDEEESEEFNDSAGHGSHNSDPGMDIHTEITSEQTVDIPSQEQNVFLNHGDTFYNTPDPLTFSSKSTMLTVPHDATLTSTDTENMTMIDMFGMSITNQIERTQIIQTVSIPLNQEMSASIESSSSSPPAPKHQKSTSKPLSCNVCREQFNTRSELNAHRASHTGDSPVTCNMCGKVFVSKNTLGIHMRIHTGVKPYVCLLCGKRFTQNGGLRIHLRTHSGEKPFTCVVCQTSFNNPSNLRRHMITHNSV